LEARILRKILIHLYLRQWNREEQMVVIDGNTKRAHPLLESSQPDEIPSSFTLHTKLTRTVCYETIYKIRSSDRVGEVQLLCRIRQPGPCPHRIETVELGGVCGIDVVQRLRLHQVYIRQPQHDPVDTGIITLVGPKTIPVFVEEWRR